MRQLYALLSFLLLGSIAVTAQEYDTIRVCTYNILEFDSESSDRIDELRLILNEIRPRILLVQSIASEKGHDLLRDSVASRLDVPLRAAGLLGDDQESYDAIFYDSSTFKPSSAYVIADTPRDVISVRLHYGGRGIGDSIQIITARWNAGETPDDELSRLEDAETIDDFVNIILPADDHEIDNILFGGDLNLYSSQERAYLHLTIAPTNRLYDPISRPGDWHDNESFADLHTESTRNRPFGGGETGGMDDRFDHILVSDSVRTMSARYSAFGNDGLHFNDSINAPPNTAVGPVMAQALHDASDHLPVYLELLFPRVTTDVREGSQPAERLDLVSRERR